MTTLGVVPFANVASVVDARSKVRRVVLALGADDIKATRLSTAASQAVRHVLQLSDSGSLELSLDRDAAQCVLSLRLSADGPIAIPDHLAPFFESSQAGADGLSFRCRLGVVGVDDLAIQQARAVIAERSRDQLMAEISEQNEALEKAKVQLEQTVLERTSDLEVALEEVEVQRQAADSANQAKSAFLANMSHELRTPMNAIIGYSEMLTEDAEDDGLDEMAVDLNKINAAGNHLLSLINDILDLSKIEAGRMELFLETFELHQILDEVVSTAQPLFEKNDNEFVLEAADGLGSVHADVTKVRQALFNLLSNAAKFTDSGTITLTVRREERDGVGWFSMAVADSGIGIAADKLDTVFEEFAQADESTTRDFGGTGLGLALTRQLCQMMGGDISLESELGVGTTFTIELPTEVVAEPDGPD